MKVVMLVANPFTDEVWTDPRVDKEARALLETGHQVIVIGTGKYGQNPHRCEVKDNLTIIRRPTILHQLYTWFKPPKPSVQRGSRMRQVYYEKTSSRGFKARLVARFLQFMSDLNNLLFCLAVLPEAIRQKGDVYEGHDFNALPVAYVAARLTGGKLIYNAHELWTERVRGVPYDRWHKALVIWTEKILCQRCDLVITMSDSVAQILSERYNIATPLVVPNVQHYVETSPSTDIRAELTNDHLKQIAIYVGYLDYGKGLEELIDAVPYLQEGIGIAIVGDGVLRPMLEARVKEKHLEDKVRFVGWVTRDQVPFYLASADIGVSPIQGKWLNYYHNLDNKVFDYVMAGIPLAVSDQPEKRRLVEKYDIGKTFDETDPQDIARTINQLLSNPTKYEAMRANCRKVAREELNWEVVSGQYVSALEKLVNT